jgi:hypothetical protein
MSNLTLPSLFFRWRQSPRARASSANSLGGADGGRSDCRGWPCCMRPRRLPPYLPLWLPGQWPSPRQARRLSTLLATPAPVPPAPADYRERSRQLTGLSLDLCPCCGGAMVPLGPSPRAARQSIPTWVRQLMRLLRLLAVIEPRIHSRPLDHTTTAMANRDRPEPLATPADINRNPHLKRRLAQKHDG